MSSSTTTTNKQGDGAKASGGGDDASGAGFGRSSGGVLIGGSTIQRCGVVATATAAVGANKNNSTSNNTNRKSVVFPVGRAGKNELRRALRARGAASNPQRTIETFQREHSLHSMMCKAFGTQPRQQQTAHPSSTSATATTRASAAKAATVQQNTASSNVESLDTDSVMEFLSHLGVSQYEVHKRISDTLLKKLEDEIKRTSTSSSSQQQQQQQSLLDLLQNSWAYAVALPELRPIVWAVLRQLGEQTPHDVLLELARRADTTNDSTTTDDNNNISSSINITNNSVGSINMGRSVLKHAEIFRPLPVLLKKLVWEADFYNLIPAATAATKTTPSNEQQTDRSSTSSPTTYLEQARHTLWYQTIAPTMQQYCQNPTLVEAANRMLGVGPRERKMVTTQRRALTTTTTTTTTTGTAGGVASTTTTGGSASAAAASTAAAATASLSATSTSAGTTAAALLRGATGATSSAAAAAAAAAASEPPSGKAIAQLRVYLSDKGGSNNSNSSRSISGSSSSYRPKLLYALLSILVAQHGAVMTGDGGGGGGGSIGTTPATTNAAGVSSDSLFSQQPQQQQYHGYLGGATYLHCTLLADLLLSAGGPLPKAYQHVISLARVLDECVQEGTVSDKALVKIQSILKHIFQTDPAEGPDDNDDDDDFPQTTATGSATKKAAKRITTSETCVGTNDDGDKKSSAAASSSSSYSFSAPISSAAKRQLNRILTSSMSAMKMADPQSLFLNDVTDEIAPGYSKIIKKPMCISAMEKKVAKNAYETLVEFER
jgi:Bromodomain